MVGEFEVAAGSVIGKDHRRDGRNNQDAYIFRVMSGSVIAIVCDGCGSGKHSEVGAKLGAELLTRNVITQLQRRQTGGSEEELTSNFWERVRQDTLAELRVLANRLSDSLSGVVNDYFLFTVVGAVITPQFCSFVSIGDGVIVVNDEAIVLGPYPNNEPPYLAYGLVDTSLTRSDPDALKFKIEKSLPADQLDSFLIGSDGVVDLMNVDDQSLPGREEKIGPLSQFWQGDRYFTNPDNIRRRLTMINREAYSAQWESRTTRTDRGRLPDDTTLVVGRKIT